MLLRLSIPALLALLIITPAATAQKEPPREGVEFFEKKIRPVLVEHCYSCHSSAAKKLRGQLRVDTREGLLKGGRNGLTIVPGRPAEGTLLPALRHASADLKMPPDKKLPDAVIADFEAWIKMGAPDPRGGKVAKGIDAAKHWSLQPVKSPPIPEIDQPRFAGNPIDRFIASAQRANKVTPAGPTDKHTLIRRATFDLTGLPPTPDEIEAFVKDDSTDAFAKLVDRLLANPAYGERWGRHWMDVVRYADTAGDNSDYPIPQMYLYRNWIIDALNRDMPYDQFVREQFAGDLLPASSPEDRRNKIIATGYLANTRRFGSYEDKRYQWYLTIEDSIDNLGRAILGSTIHCARCHDHKFDPFTTQDYYALYGIFASTLYSWPGIELDKVQRDMVPLGKDEVAYAVVEGKNDPKKRIGQIGDVKIQIKGDPDYLGATVPRRFPTVLGGQPLPDGFKGSGRLQLAHWLTDAKNPLTARVLVNRVWHYHFGRGIVATPNDFGKLGAPPTHPELLDYLADAFVADGWSLKKLHRRIMLTETYRLASTDDDANQKIDPDNRFHWRGPRRRLEAEAIRDSLLAVSGRLDRTPGAAHPFPEMKKWNFTQHKPFKEVYDTNRRTVYVMTQRIARHPFLGLFDGPDTNASTGARTVSTTTLQALYLMNDPFVHEQAKGLAARLRKEKDTDDARVDHAFRLCFGRPIRADEARATAAALGEMRMRIRAMKLSPEQAEAMVWESVARSIFLSSEFIYVD